MCPMHPCKCRACKARRRDGYPVTADCKWRHSAAAFIEVNYSAMIQDDMQNPRLSYMHIVDLHGLPTPRSARIRNLLNVCSRMPGFVPLADTFAVVDVSQQLLYRPWSTDGTVLPIATNTSLWSIRLAKFLTTSQMYELMGHRLSQADTSFNGISDTAQRKLIGNSIHVAVIGSLMIASVAMACPD